MMLRFLWLLVLCACCVPCLAAESETPPATYDFGDVRVGKEVRHTFTIASGAREMAITKISPSCSCCKVISFSPRIPANSKGEVIVELKETRVGEARVDIAVESAGREPIMLQLKGRFVDVMDGLDRVKYVEARDIVSQLTKFVVIDVRSPNAHVMVHALGSQSVDLFQLPARLDLQDKEVVILDDGLTNVSMRKQIVRMNWPRVSVLRGGLHEWIKAGGQVAGTDVRTGRRFRSHVSAKAFYQETLVTTPASGHAHDTWQVVRISAAGESRPELALPFSVTNVGAEKDVAMMGEALLRAIGEVKDQNTKLLVVNDDGQNYEILYPYLDTISRPVFLLEGGTASYMTYAKFQTAIRRQKTAASVTGVSIKSNEANGQVVRGGGCGACK
ncbi:hypothetical protein DB346_02205 [Verrucomicrobia bacterium LW23]|nr:hypothetical protein DB346_02205 [Verrucomicrobia bacterium LW23]